VGAIVGARYKGSHSLGVQQSPQLPRLTGEGKGRFDAQIGAATFAGILPQMVPMGRRIDASALQNPGKVGRDLNGDGAGGGVVRHLIGAVDSITLADRQRPQRLET